MSNASAAPSSLSSDHITGETLELRTRQDVLDAIRPDVFLTPRCVKIHVILLQDDDDIHLVQRGLCRLRSNCQELVFLVTDYEPMVIHASVLSSLLAIVNVNNQNQQLKQLSFSSMNIHGDMTPVLRCMTSVQQLSIHYCRFYNAPHGSETSTLQIAARILQYTPSLKAVELFAYSLTQDAVAFLEAVQSCHSLQKLTCHGMHSRSLDKDGIEALGRLLGGTSNRSHNSSKKGQQQQQQQQQEQPCPSLQEISVSVDRCACLKPLEQALAQNEGLQKLDIFRDGWQCDPVVDQQNLQVFCNVLRDFNYTLVKCYIRWNDATRTQRLQQEFQELDFYIRMNVLGRRTLLAKMEDRPYWGNFVLQHQNDLSVLHYVLLQNPLMLTSC